jgi:hypothetical protein
VLCRGVYSFVCGILNFYHALVVDFYLVPGTGGETGWRVGSVEERHLGGTSNEIEGEVDGD